MKTAYRKRSLFLALVLVFSCFALSAGVFADGTEPRSISLRPGNRELRKDATFQLTVVYKPADADTNTEITWSSSDEDVAEVDSDGWVSAIGPGTAKITAKTANGKKAEVTITVPGKVEDERLKDGWREFGTSDPTEADTQATTSPTTPTQPKTTATEPKENKLSQDALVEAVKAAGTKTAIMKGYTSVSAEALQAAAKAGKAAVRFDTLLDKAVTGCVTIAPANAAELSGDIALGVYSSGSKIQDVQNKFVKSYRNKLQVIYCEQAAYGMTVTIRAKVGDLSTENLRLYAYDKTKNTFKRLSTEGAAVDANGYLKFSTTTGGYIIASEGPLKK